jgi:hypothetical protein
MDHSRLLYKAFAFLRNQLKDPRGEIRGDLFYLNPVPAPVPRITRADYWEGGTIDSILGKGASLADGG